MSKGTKTKYVRYETKHFPEELMIAVRVRAARTRRTLEWVVNELIALGLSQTDSEERARYTVWVERARSAKWGSRDRAALGG